MSYEAIAHVCHVHRLCHVSWPQGIRGDDTHALDITCESRSRVHDGKYLSKSKQNDAEEGKEGYKP